MSFKQSISNKILQETLKQEAFEDESSQAALMMTLISFRVVAFYVLNIVSFFVVAHSQMIVIRDSKKSKAMRSNKVRYS